MKTVIMDGNEACSNSSYMLTQAAGIYPITPSSPMAEHVDEWSREGRKNIFGNQVDVIEMQSEAGASGLVHGLLKAGVLTTTYTASQGLLLMIPNMYKMAGELLPCVMHVAARSLSTHALSILGDHQDIYAARSTGFAMLASSNVQDTAYLSLVAHLSSIKSSVPFLHFFDGFRTSHELNKIHVLEEEDIKDWIDYEAIQKFHARTMNPNHPYTSGTNQNDDIYFQATEARNTYYDNIPNIVASYMEKINKRVNSDYLPFNYYGSSKAKKVIVAMGSVCDTIKEVIDDLNEEIGLIEVHLYRPFSKEYFLKVLPESVEKIAVLDRTKEPGSVGEPLYLDVKSILKDKEVVGGRYGLSSKNTTPAQIKAVYDMLDHPKHNFTIGIVDDVTNLSLPITNYTLKNSYDFLIYGYGSDGMISASKSFLKMVGKDHYVQGYFQYDSKKSGGVTKSHLRVSKEAIRSTYYIEKPNFVVLTKDNYLKTFDVLENIEENGIFLLNTIQTEEEIIQYLPNHVKNKIVEKKIKFYIINAYELGRKYGLGNKISTIMEVAILSLTNFTNYEESVQILKEEMEKRFGFKNKKLVENNQQAMDQVLSYIKQISITGNYIEEERPNYVDIFLSMQSRRGDQLKVSSFLDRPDGIFPPATSQYEKRCISDIVPSWVNSKCIQCNLCSLICPHGVIRPFELSEEEYNKAPDFIKTRCKGRFILGISVKDCTGCGLCIKTCPTNSLIKERLVDQNQEVFDYLVQNISCKVENRYSVKTSQFVKPKFEFSGACAGCGETPYIKLLTQLFDSLMIANATGCSSIYGASAPSMPYSIPWASSLFEDNAEYGMGMVVADKIKKQQIITIMKQYQDPIFEEYIKNPHSYEITKETYSMIDFEKYPLLKPFKDFIIKQNIWILGGDGWAYDIGFSGIDHALASGENVKILVLDTQVYSNTGGQASKATPIGSTALFASSGKKTYKKDLAHMMLSYSNVYVAQVSLGANPMQTIKAFKEANEYIGPAIIIAYSPCISHGIMGGMENSIQMEKEAVTCGYFPIFHYSPLEKKFYLDCKPDFSKYEEFLQKQTRYTVLEKVNKQADELLKQNKEKAISRYQEYVTLSEK